MNDTYTQFIETILNESSFSDFINKRKNRAAEFAAIAKYLPRRNEYRVFSLPYEYEFEKSFYNAFKVPMVIYVGETNFKTAHAKRFMNDTGNVVMVPSRYYKKYNAILPKYKTSVSDFTGGNVKYSMINTSRYHVVQNTVDNPTKFDIIDLDYTGSPNAQNFGESNVMFHDHLEKGGLIFLTFSLNAYRPMKLIKQKLSRELDMDVNDPTLTQFDYAALKNAGTDDKEIAKIVGDIEKYKNYGIISKGDLLQQLKNISSNILKMFVDKFGRSPVYFNIYKGGSGSKGKVMVRMVFKK
jgi:hypothetical protein